MLVKDIFNIDQSAIRIVTQMDELFTIECPSAGARTQLPRAGRCASATGPATAGTD